MNRCECRVELYEWPQHLCVEGKPQHECKSHTTETQSQWSWAATDVDNETSSYCLYFIFLWSVNLHLWKPSQVSHHSRCEACLFQVYLLPFWILNKRLLSWTRYLCSFHCQHPSSLTSVRVVCLLVWLFDLCFFLSVSGLVIIKNNRTKARFCSDRNWLAFKAWQHWLNCFWKKRHHFHLLSFPLK